MAVTHNLSSQPKRPFREVLTEVVVSVILAAAIFSLLFIFGCIAKESPQRPSPPAVEDRIPDATQPVDLPKPTVVSDLEAMHNRERTSRRLSAVTINGKLSVAAQKHADWMAKNRRMSHYQENGSTFDIRIRQAGYELFSGGENIAMGYSTPAAVMQGWMNSPGHRANILNARWREIGLGVARSSNNRLYWCAVFATPASESRALSEPPEFLEPGPLEDGPAYTDESLIPAFPDTKSLGAAHPHIIIDGEALDYHADRNWFFYAADPSLRAMWLEFDAKGSDVPSRMLLHPHRKNKETGKTEAYIDGQWVEDDTIELPPPPPGATTAGGAREGNDLAAAAHLPGAQEWIVGHPQWTTPSIPTTIAPHQE